MARGGGAAAGVPRDDDPPRDVDAPLHDAPLGVALLGSTGSIGTQALDVLRSAGPERFRVVALAAGRDAATLGAQLHEVRPLVAALADPAAAAALDVPPGVTLDRDPDAMERFATRDDVDLVVVATGGIVSLRPVIAALRAGKVVATANKETLVAGGHLVMPLAAARAAERRAQGVTDPLGDPLGWVRPIDSEHSALWQCLVGERHADIQRLILTASGGPFRTWDAARLAAVTPRDALAHPTWDMGAKITIDSATLLNKGLEVIEACWLYDVAIDSIDVLVHPQSLVHSMVEFVDGSLKAQLGLPDMRIPIQYALTWPTRIAGPAPRLDLLTQDALRFEALDDARFPAVDLARTAFAAGPRATAALICADEVAVARFLDGTLSFPAITDLVAAAVTRFGDGAPPDVPALTELDREVRAWAATADVPESRTWA
ncbi:MAG: 1-deoxy-D-xylulose-5-phosphate reductoisomerase [Chloroflexi bacterium]|nr:1-deoxy-D-xylulose-5-phosphate reductoisomerase [Chloroflexota bacterium]